MVRPVSFKGFQKGFQGVSDFPLGIMWLYQIPQRRGKLHYVFDTDCSGIMTRARFSGKKGSFEPSCEVNRNMLKSGVDPAILLHRYPF